MSKAYRFGSIRCARESVPTAMLVLERYGFVVLDSIRDAGDRVTFQIDLGRLPDRMDGQSAEGMVMREVERAVSLHAVQP